MYFKLNFLLLLFVCLFYSKNFLLAQNRLKTGYIITNTNDTIRGEIDYFNWMKNPSYLTLLQNGQKKEYSPSNSKGFYIIEFAEYYQSYEGQIDNTSKKIDEQYRTGTLQGFMNYSDRFKHQKVFLRRFFSLHNYQLFVYNDNRNKEHFFIKKDTLPIVPLFNQQFLWTKTNGLDYTVNTEEYKKTLIALFADDPNIESKVLNLPYTQKGLAKFLVMYISKDNKEEQKILLKKVQQIDNTYFTISGLVGYNNLSNKIPTLGISLRQVVPRSFQRWVFITDITYNIDEFNSLGTNYSSSHIFLLPQVRLRILPRNQLIPIVSVGTPVRMSISNIADTRTYSMLLGSLSFGGGFEYKRFAIEGRYEYFALPTTKQFYQVHLTYRISKR